MTDRTRPLTSVLHLIGGTRRRRMITAIVVILVIAVVATGVAVSPLSRLFGGRETAIDHRCIPATSAQPLGFAMGSGLLSLPDDDLSRMLDLTAAAGVGWVRFDIPWSTVETTRGQDDWTLTDRVVDAAHSRGLKVLGIVDTTPGWARLPAAADKEFSLPADPTQFGAFAGRAAARYGDRISAWEIWNEPNIVNFAAPAPDVSRYAAMLSAASAAIRSAGPRDTPIVTAGLSPAVDGDGSIAPTTFLTQLYRVGDKSSWDAVGIHPYSYPYLPTDRSTASFNTFQKLNALYATMQRNGDGAKNLWITEYGAPTGGTSAQKVSEKFQADSIFAAVMATREQSHFGPFFVYSLRDTGTDPADAEQNFGVVHNDFTPKIAYRDLTTASECR